MILAIFVLIGALAGTIAGAILIIVGLMLMPLTPEAGGAAVIMGIIMAGICIKILLSFTDAVFP